MQAPTVIDEDTDFIILNKPSGWFSIPARVPTSGDLVITDWLKKHLGTSSAEPYVVHRLDRFTSGIMLFAKNKESHQRANLWFQNREVKKIYHFFAAPPPDRPAFQIKTPVDGKPSQTLFEVIQKNKDFFYGRATPLTGRFHQIREHAHGAGFPLLGDIAYDGVKALAFNGTTLNFPRVCLHAYELTLPFGTYQAPLADDLQKLKNLI